MHVKKPVDTIEAESSAEETLAAARTEKPRNPAQSDKKINISQSRRNFQCGQQQSCSQQAKEQIGIKITEIQQLDLQISWKNRGSEQLRTVTVFRL